MQKRLIVTALIIRTLIASVTECDDLKTEENEDSFENETMTESTEDMLETTGEVAIFLGQQTYRAEFVNNELVVVEEQEGYINEQVLEWRNN